MKKIFSILSAAMLGLVAVSCLQEPLAVFDPVNATAPVLGTVSVNAKNVTIDYTPAVFDMGFNGKIAPAHTLVLANVDGKEVHKTITSKDSGTSLMATNVNISKALAYFGYTDGEKIGVLDIAVRASIQDLSKDNGRNGFVDSERYRLYNFTVTLPQGSPYADYTELSTWSVIGKLSNYDIDWNGDLEVFSTEDGKLLVAKAVKLSKDDEFKFRKDQAWDVNMGGSFTSLDAEFSVSQDGPNIKVGADGTYDLWLDLNANTATVTDAYLPYPDHKDASTWSVIGKLSGYDIDWNGDLPMITDGKTHVAQGIKIAAGDEFKFRKDKGWDVNMGGDFGGLGSEFSVTQDGPNIKVGTDGIYDLILDPNGTATIVETLGGGVSGKIGGDEPEPEPDTYQGWGIIGDFNSWGADAPMTEKDGVWTGYFTNITKEDGGDGEFKLRKDGKWDENAGGTFIELGVAFDAVTADAPNIVAPAGFYQVVYDTNTQKITVSAGEMWSLIGAFNEWGGDVDMVLTDGKWVSPATKLSGDFKIRHNHDWTLSVGGEMEELGKPFTAVSDNGPNIKVEEGEYIVTFDPTAMTIVVDAALPANKWSVIGDFNEWGGDAYMTEVLPGIWVSDELDLTDGGWKIRFNNGWDINRGGATPAAVGEFVAAYPGGDNITLGGKCRVVFNEMNQTIGTLGWGVVGKIASIDGFEWNKDIPMNLAPDGKWYSIPVKYTKDDEIKIRFGAAWDENFGGNATAADEAFATGGDNIKIPADGTYMLVYDPTASTITLSTDFWGLIGEFNEWGGDRFMLPAGDGKWYAFNQEISGGWKIRKTADWTISAGGNYAAAGTAFEAVTDNGDNIAVTDMTRFDVLYDTAAGTITVSEPVK